MNHGIDRRAFIVIALSVAACTSAAPTALGRCSPRRVLFICQFGTVKSAVARELLRRRAAERGMAIEVRSRGLTPEEHMSPALALAVQKDGIDTHTEPVRKLAAADVERADVVIFFDKLPPGFAPADLRDWSDLPSMNADYPAARAVLMERIDRLLDEAAGALPGKADRFESLGTSRLA